VASPTAAESSEAPLLPLETGELDVAAVAGFLAGSVGGFAGKPRARRFAGGLSNPTFLFEAGGDRCVIRCGPPLPNRGSAHRIDREFHILGGLTGTGVPVPRPLAFCSDPAVLGREFYAMDYVAGGIFAEPALPAVDGSRRAVMYRSAARILGALHDLDPEVLGLPAPKSGRPPYAQRQVRRWTEVVGASGEDVPGLAELGRWLDDRHPAKEQIGIVHGDYRFGNLLFDPAGEIAAVLDWELTTVGDPRADLAYFCLAYHLDAAAGRGLVGIAGDGLAGIPSEGELVAEYADARGVAAPEELDFFLVLSLFRTAAILCDVASRARRGVLRDARAEGASERAHQAVQAGLLITGRAG
jgi:aminoglycoside phosphotransferase (APT) family kinase protein